MNTQREPARTVGFQDAPVVAQASAEERAAFITRTYLHLLARGGRVHRARGRSGSRRRSRGAMISLMSAGKFAWLVVLGAFIGVSYLANKWALSSTSLGKQYAGLGLFVVAESILFLPLIAMALIVGAQGEEGLLGQGGDDHADAVRRR